MDLLQKIETLLRAAARTKLPRRERRSILDDEEEKILLEIRHALQQVEAQERLLAQRIKTERTEAEAAANRADWTAQRSHERRAFELERELEQESLQAINIEEKLAALEEKLALAQAAVDKEARQAAERDAAASKILDAPAQPAVETAPPPPPAKPQTKDLATRKSRLAG